MGLFNNGILTRLFSSGNKVAESDENNALYDVDEKGKKLFKEDIISFVTQELEERKRDRTGWEKQWIVNANYLSGNQFCEFNTYRGEIEQIAPVYDWMEREVFNQISPLIETRIANLKKLSYSMRVRPRTNELKDYAKAQVSTSLLRYKQNSTDFFTANDIAIVWNEVCGSVFWLSWWDKSKGEYLGSDTEITIGDDGVENKVEHAYYEGDLDYGVITPYEVYPESLFKDDIKSQRSIILEQVKSVDDIYDLYGVEVEGMQVETFSLIPQPSGGGFGYEATTMTLGHKTVDNAQKVITYFERPSRRRPNGRMIIIVGETELVYYGDLPYSRIPLVQCVCHKVPGQFFGKSTIEELIPRQRAYNGCINRIHEYIKRIALQEYMVEEGSIDIEFYEQEGQAPGAMLVYKNGYDPPTPVQNGVLPSEIMAERFNLKADMEYIAGTSQLMVNGALPSGVTSGTAIQNLMDIDNTRLSLTGDNLRSAVRELAIVWLEILKKYAKVKRVVNYVGKNDIATTLIWSGEEINSYDVIFETENELMLSEETQHERFREAYNMGAFTDENGMVPMRVKLRVLEGMKIGNYTEIMNIDTLQMQAAQRENVFFEEGVVPKVSDLDDHNIHTEEHMRYALQMDFQILKQTKPDYAELFLDHIRQHKQATEQNKMAQMMQLQ